MIKQYKEFFMSSELMDMTPYAESIIADDVEAFKDAFATFADEDLMIDPVEICAAYGSENIFHHLVSTYDYSDYQNPFRLTLPMILIIFERENLLFEALERIPFNQEHFSIMYEFMLQTKEPEYFIQFYEAYGIDTKYRKDLLIYSLEHRETFEYLLGQKGYKKHLKDEDIIYEIIAYRPTMLHYVEAVRNLDHMFESASLVPVLQIEDEALFKKTVDFILERNIDLNRHNEFGLTFFHEALRHASNPGYLFYLVEKGANPLSRTTRGYAASHQLLFRNAEFTLELSQLVDLDAKDLFGLMLKDYDALQRKTSLQLLDVLLVSKLVLNMDESAIYELDNAEYYDLASIHGVEPFLNVYSIAVFENRHFKELFHETFDRDIRLEDVSALQHSLDDAFEYDDDIALELLDDVIALEDEDFEAIAAFAKNHNTTIKFMTDSVELNKIGQIDITVHADGTVFKSAQVHSNYIDVYYFHTYYGIPLENIAYTPKISKKQRFLN